MYLDRQTKPRPCQFLFTASVRDSVAQRLWAEGISLCAVAVKSGDQCGGGGTHMCFRGATTCHYLPQSFHVWQITIIWYPSSLLCASSLFTLSFPPLISSFLSHNPDLVSFPASLCLFLCPSMSLSLFPVNSSLSPSSAFTMTLSHHFVSFPQPPPKFDRTNWVQNQYLYN